MARRKILIALVLAVALLGGGVGVLGSSNSYQLSVLMPTADGTFTGGKVMMRGQRVGTITDVGVLDDKALVTAEIDSQYAPVHSGTSARVSWDSVVGSRVLEILPGAVTNPPLPSGRMIESKTERVEIGDVVAMFDGPTRRRVQELVKGLNETLVGREGAVRATLKTAGPAVGALGEVLRAVGQDGPAIRDLVKRVHAMVEQMAQRDTELRETVGNLGQFTFSMARKQESVKEVFDELPRTLRAAKTTLDVVPGTVNATVPLLKDLEPATKQLPGIAANLSPVLRELRPTVANLKPTLVSTHGLLDRTPRLLDVAHGTLPDVEQAATTLQPGVAFLRPYTPELAGWLSNWTSLFASYNSAGNYGRVHIPVSATSFNDSPVPVLPPGLRQIERPAPGSNAGQPWRDANGDGIR